MLVGSFINLLFPHSKKIKKSPNLENKKGVLFLKTIWFVCFWVLRRSSLRLLTAGQSSSVPCTKDRSPKRTRMCRGRMRDIELCPGRRCNHHRRRSRLFLQSCKRRKDGNLCHPGWCATLGRTLLCSRSVHVLGRVPVRSKPKRCLWVEILQLVSKHERNVAAKKFSEICFNSFKDAFVFLLEQFNKFSTVNS